MRCNALWLLILVATSALAACAQSPAAPPASTSPPKAVGPTTAPASSPSPAAPASPLPSPSAPGGRLQLGSFSYNDRGTQSVAGQSELELEADDFYFSPTFLRGSPGQKLTLQIENEGKETHNLTLSGQQVDKDIAPDGKIDVEVTFPASGALRFFCKYHSAEGMNGQLLAGDATPQPVSLRSGRADY